MSAVEWLAVVSLSSIFFFIGVGLDQTIKLPVKQKVSRYLSYPMSARRLTLASLAVFDRVFGSPRSVHAYPVDAYTHYG
jgi:hypothetical protein